MTHLTQKTPRLNNFIYFSLDRQRIVDVRLFDSLFYNDVEKVFGCNAQRNQKFVEFLFMYVFLLTCVCASEQTKRDRKNIYIYIVSFSSL